MEVIEIIKSRRSIGLVEAKDIPDETIEILLDAATWAPNHKNTEPWKFRVVKGEARIKLGDKMAEITAKKYSHLSIDELNSKIEKSKNGPLRAPVIIVLAVSPSGKVPEIEEYVACGCAMQNLLLTATEKGIATFVRTGDIAFEKELNQYLQLEETDTIVGLIYAGYPKTNTPITKKRIPASQKTIWFK